MSYNREQHGDIFDFVLSRIGAEKGLKVIEIKLELDMEHGSCFIKYYKTDAAGNIITDGQNVLTGQTTYSIY